MPRKSSNPSPANATSKPRSRQCKAATRTPLPEAPASRPLSPQELEVRIRAILKRIQAT
ncbi:hypothetical protein J0H58_20300 [bacterium]|nr:hypothetical protein [bacterium]